MTSGLDSKLALNLTRRNSSRAGVPGALPAVVEWAALTPARDGFRRVRFSASFEAKPDVMVYSSGSAVRDDINGPGTWAFVPARLADGRSVVINAGFVQ